MSAVTTTTRPMPTRHERIAQRRHELAALFRVRRRDLVAVLAIGILQAIALVAFILMLGRIVDSLQVTEVGAAAQRSYELSLAMCGGMAVAAVLLGVLRAAEFTIAEKAGYEVVRVLRMAMYAHLQRMMPGQLRHRARGGLLLRLTGDLSMLRMWLSRGYLEGLVAVIVLTAGIGVVVWLNVWIALAMVAALALTAALSLGSGKAMRAATRTMRRRRSLLIGNIDEQINSLAVVQTGGRTAGEYARLSRQNDSLNRALGRVAELRGRLRGIATFGASLVTVAVLAIGLVEVRSGTATIGDVVAAVIVARYLARPIRILGLAHDYWHRGQVSRAKVSDFLVSSGRRPESDALERLSARRGVVEFDHVTVHGALKNASATAYNREVIAITGPSGAGKTTLLNLIARLVDADEGVVRIDGQDITQTAPQSAARRIGYVSRDLPLMRGTIRRNLTYAARDASPEEVQRVAYLLGIDRLLERHGQGIHSWVTEGGGNLTVGDRQLIAIGRAMVGNPVLLLLDEPMTGLDAQAQQRVRFAIERYQGTVLLVSHDERDLALADQVWVLEDGAIVDTMTGEEYRDRVWMNGGEPWLAQPAM
ncbi:ABC transporter ATP-binding protein [Actinomycetota bacterium]